MRCIHVLTLFALTACASFPQVDAVASKNLGPRPALLTVGQLNAVLPHSLNAVDASDVPADDLRARAVGLRDR